MYCKSCKYWSKVTDWGDGVDDDGKCSRILNNGITIEIEAGWSGGVVESIETPETFGCTLHEEKE